MTKFFVLAAIAVGLGTSAMLGLGNGNASADSGAEAIYAADGAFRDGLFLGRLSAEHGQPSRPAIGRWSTEQDRAMFSAGYRRGYSEVR